MLADCFCKLAIRKVYLSLLFSPVKKRNVLCSDEHVTENTIFSSQLFISISKSIKNVVDI